MVMVAEPCEWTKNIELYALKMVEFMMCELDLNKAIRKKTQE